MSELIYYIFFQNSYFIINVDKGCTDLIK